MDGRDIQFPAGAQQEGYAMKNSVPLPSVLPYVSRGCVKPLSKAGCPDQHRGNPLSEFSAFCYEGYNLPFDAPWRMHYIVVKAADSNQVSLTSPRRDYGS